MPKHNNKNISDPEMESFIAGKPAITRELLDHFLQAFHEIGTITVQPTKTMIGISNAHKRIAWVTQLGKDFVHVVFPFSQAYEDNFCFQKIAQVPGDSKQFNHHFRMYLNDDVNDEVKKFMKLAYTEEG